MTDKKDIKEECIEQEQFNFVQNEKRIFDKKFDTKPIGYFKDAMIRFTKNRGNVVASIILGVIILCSIFVPILSPKNAEVLEERVAFLPPRIPLLEDIGIATGYKSKTDQQVDMDTIDPETGLGLPATIDSQYIIMDTLTNYWVECTEEDELCIGGTNILRLDSGSTAVAVNTAMKTYMPSINSEITIIVDEMFGEGAELNLMMVDGFGAYKVVATITEAGTYTINPFDTLTSLFTFTAIRLELRSDDASSYASLTSIEVNDTTQEEPILFLEGFEFSELELVSGVDLDDDGEPDYAGSWGRSQGQRLMSYFEYDAYAFVFGEKTENVFSKSEYEQILIDYADVCVISPDPDNANGWLFSEGCPIVKVINQTESVWVDTNKDGLRTDNEEYYNYKLVLNYAQYKGYDEIPYYIFGTTSQGKDLFKMIWIGARTSLILGLIVSAINISVGILFGAVSGYYGGTVDLIMQRFSEVIGRIPWLVSLSIFTALVGPGQTTLILVLIINGWIGIASITRTQFYRYKGREYVLASRTLGAKDGRLIFRHILPNGIGTIITSAILSIPYVIFTESTLSYLGFGIGHGQSLNIFGFELTGASIGVLLNDGRNKMRTEPYLTLWPAIVISILMITFNMFGNALRDAFNPALRGSE
ncbi:MAG: ABC transporter permease [Tenericutes bacterium]|nr:ABC transporter permease [Mycoplasmatota bacterium]